MLVWKENTHRCRQISHWGQRPAVLDVLSQFHRNKVWMWWFLLLFTNNGSGELCYAVLRTQPSYFTFRSLDGMKHRSINFSIQLCNENMIWIFSETSLLNSTMFLCCRAIGLLIHQLSAPSCCKWESVLLFVKKNKIKKIMTNEDVHHAACSHKALVIGDPHWRLSLQ